MARGSRLFASARPRFMNAQMMPPPDHWPDSIAAVQPTMRRSGGSALPVFTHQSICCWVCDHAGAPASRLSANVAAHALPRRNRHLSAATPVSPLKSPVVIVESTPTSEGADKWKKTGQAREAHVDENPGCRLGGCCAAGP